MARITHPQRRMLDDLQRFTEKHPQHAIGGMLVSGREYLTADALERRGLARLRYQGPGNRGWVSLVACAECRAHPATPGYPTCAECSARQIA